MEHPVDMLSTQQLTIRVTAFVGLHVCCSVTSTKEVFPTGSTFGSLTMLVHTAVSLNVKQETNIVEYNNPSGGRLLQIQSWQPGSYVVCVLFPWQKKCHFIVWSYIDVLECMCKFSKCVYTFCNCFILFTIERTLLWLWSERLCQRKRLHKRHGLNSGDHSCVNIWERF